ncbi:MAG TPA: 2-oxoglutarate ferredoxin oxidoreductase subunit alpha [Deltaproteobacteria bacterium]|nr:2-oxoglutarate ferredoxin oxidoreductase subunit alpha [Deltaproteobacteria bacterium]
MEFPKTREEIDSAVIRFAGDSGDGMQLTGTQFTTTSAVLGNDISTLPDFPAEIRAPAGSLPGVSAFQLHFSSRDIRTPGDEPNVLVAMNPAALKTNLRDLPPGGLLIVNKDAFNERNLERAGYAVNPLQDESLKEYRVIAVPISSLNQKALEDLSLSNKEKDRCKNLFALGMMYWMYDRPLEHTIHWIERQFAKKPDIVEANIKALKAGFHFAETAEIISTHYRIRPAKLKPGKYRNLMGNTATALGFVTAARLADTPLLYCSYPITPASDILHELAKLKNFQVRTVQAEDEIAAIGAAIGAAFGGCIAMTGTSGPGLALKSEALNLAVMAELPLIVLDIQRGGPSTGLPTKTEQADLLQAMFGRNGESPVPIVAPATPADCFAMAMEAVKIAVKYMTPVLYLSDGYLANGSEPWRIPHLEDLPKIEIRHPQTVPGEKFLPYLRDPHSLARPWAIPGTPGLEHRIGGLEKEDRSGNVSYDPANHEKMVKLRAAKVAAIAQDIPDAEILGPAEGELLVVGWGSTYGAIASAVERARAEGASVSAVHLRYLNPFPRNLEALLQRFDKILVPELNLGQLAWLLRAKFLVEARSLSKVQGKPFKITEILEGIRAQLSYSAPQMPRAKQEVQHAGNY